MSPNMANDSRKLPEKDTVFYKRRNLHGNKDFLKTNGVRLVAFFMVFLLWELIARSYNSDLLLPSPWKVALAFMKALHDKEVLSNLILTLTRVMTGFSLAFDLAPKN